QMDRQEAELVAHGAPGQPAGIGHMLQFRRRQVADIRPLRDGGAERCQVGVECTRSHCLRGKQRAQEQQNQPLHGAPPLPFEVLLLGFPLRRRSLRLRMSRCMRPSCHTTNCSARLRSSRLCSGSNSSVTVRSRDSRITTSTTSRVSCESAVTLTGRLYGSSTSKRTSVSALRMAPRQRRGRNAAIGVSAIVCEPSGRIGPCAEKLYAVLPAGVATITPSQISSSSRCWPLRSMRMCAACRVCRSSETSLYASEPTVLPDSV